MHTHMHICMAIGARAVAMQMHTNEDTGTTKHHNYIL